MKDKSPLVSIIVLTINNLTLLKNCLESLVAQDYLNLEIIVVDNGSDQDIEGMLKSHYPQTRFIRLELNCGFAGGNNRAMDVAAGKYLALINNDAVASSNWISELVKVAESQKDVGAVTSLIMDGNRTGVVDSFGNGFALDGMSKQAMHGQEVPPNFKEPVEVPLFSGCACLLRVSALEETGKFDEDFFSYCEDTDLSLRLRLAGWKIIATPEAIVEHYYSKTGEKFPLQQIYWVERNHYWVVVKSFPFILLPLVPITTLWRFLILIYFFVRREEKIRSYTDTQKKAALFKVFLKSYVDMVRKLPAMIGRRRAFARRRKVGNWEATRMFWRFRMPMVKILRGKRT